VSAALTSLQISLKYVCDSLGRGHCGRTDRLSEIQAHLEYWKSGDDTAVSTSTSIHQALTIRPSYSQHSQSVLSSALTLTVLLARIAFMSDGPHMPLL